MVSGIPAREADLVLKLFIIFIGKTKKLIEEFFNKNLYIISIPFPQIVIQTTIIINSTFEFKIEFLKAEALPYFFDKYNLLIILIDDFQQFDEYYLVIHHHK